MHGETLDFTSWWWYALGVAGLWLTAALGAPNAQGRISAIRWGRQLWVEGWPMAWAHAIMFLSIGLAVGLLNAGYGIDPRPTGIVLLAPWLIHILSGFLWNAARSHQAYHQFRMVFVPVILALALPYVWLNAVGQAPQPDFYFSAVFSVFAVLYLTSLFRAAYIYITHGPGPLYFRISYLCALEAIPWLWIYYWLNASEK